MLTHTDLKQLAEKGISASEIENQLNEFRTGFPYLKLDGAASIGNGILSPNEEERKCFIGIWENYKKEGHKIVKFVPASGAASRMFKNMFAFADADYDVPETDFEKKYFECIKEFAFYDALNEKVNVENLLEAGQYKSVVNAMLDADGLNYGKLPKGILLFHKYADGARTPMEEHLVEGVMYAESDGEVNLHFTVSAEHMEYFKNKVAEKELYFANKYGVKFNISFSVQKPSTDTVAATLDNQLFRDENGQLVFRPGGHGALIENLNDTDADIIFIKNIDNVVPDRLKAETVTYKNLLAGILVDLQKKVFEYLNILDSNNYNEEDLCQMVDFLEKQLCCKLTDSMHKNMTAELIHKKLNRPMRVCGVVKNVGEPGGGPFRAYNQDGTISLQILESSQIDTSNKEYQKMFEEGTHFNPVDLVCAIKNYKGEAFNLPDYVDKSTGFITSKSKNGKELRALELPGLWNGAMSDWNTIFVEVPLITFNPVKTVNDLLRPEHQ